jgi:hypothetical protein
MPFPFPAGTFPVATGPGAVPQPRPWGQTLKGDELKSQRRLTLTRGEFGDLDGSDWSVLCGYYRSQRRYGVERVRARREVMAVADTVVWAAYLHANPRKRTSR